jgi:glycosyltransferase involved in cell wall biosynthesis
MIVLLTHNYPNPDNPIAGLFVQDHRDQLARTTGEEVRVFNYPFGEFPMTKSIKNPLKWPKFIRYFHTLNTHIRRDVTRCIKANGGKPVRIIAHWWIPQGVYAAKYFDNVEVICHGTDMFLLQKYPRVAHMYDDRARKVIRWQCVSSHLRDVLLEMYPFLDRSRIEVAPMPIGRMFENRHQPRRKNLVVSVGSLIKRKGFDRLIIEIAKLPELELEIYGQGPEQAPLERLIADLDVHGRCRLMGPAPREHLVEVYNRATLFALLSYDEGFGLVLKEAQACGCPTLAFTGDGMIDTKIDFPVRRDEPVADRIGAVVTELAARTT